ncbi:MAG: aspartate aminotransferase family protein [Deltaproteobacteria bacterium]|nr:aspartate aminotransferase family protein [Deltaproteobacteria bacterium]
MKTDQIIALSQKYIMNTYPRMPVAPVKGKGCWLWDADGKKYLDFFSGLAVTNLGHAHPRVSYAISKQAGALLHVSNLFQIDHQAALAEKLCQNSFADKVFFCNSGAEANEAAVKLARKWGKTHKDPDCYKIITMEGSFHGRTLAMITATGQEKIKRGFEPLIPGFQYVPFGDIVSLKEKMDNTVCAVMIEPIQGEGGVRMASVDYFKELRSLCNEKRILLIFDEVQTGIGRTGTLFAYEQLGIEPDIMTIAKALAGGLPVGAMLARDFVADTFQPGDHAATFGGNPFVTFVASTVLETLFQERLLDNVREVGRYLRSGLEGLKKRYPFIKEVRGQGLLLGLELETEAKPLVMACLERGLILNAAQERVLRILPPLIVSKKEIDQGLKIMDEVFRGI